MNDAILMAELERQREDARRCFGHLGSQEQIGVIGDEKKPRILDLMESLNHVLKAHPVFGLGRDVYFATKQLNLDATYAPYLLLRVTAELGAPFAVSWLHRLFKIDHADLRMLALVHGLEVKQPVSLSNGVSLLPFAAAPDSPQFRALANRYQGGAPWTMHGNLFPPPAIAIFDMGTVAALADHTAGKATYEGAQTALFDAARAFTLTARGAPVVGVSWIDFVEPELTLAEFGMMWMGARFEGSPSRSCLDVDDEGLAWVERYLQMKAEPRPVVDLALDRLNLARRRISPGDQAIDGGICLEALLGGADKGEITYKLQLRAALLLGKTLPERSEIRKAVRDFYNLRSDVVHGRQLNGKDKLLAPLWASNGLEICTRAVRAIVEKGDLPDFPTLELISALPDNEKHF